MPQLPRPSVRIDYYGRLTVVLSTFTRRAITIDVVACSTRMLSHLRSCRLTRHSARFPHTPRRRKPPYARAARRQLECFGLKCATTTPNLNLSFPSSTPPRNPPLNAHFSARPSLRVASCSAAVSTCSFGKWMYLQGGEAAARVREKGPLTAACGAKHGNNQSCREGPLGSPNH